MPSLDRTWCTFYKECKKGYKCQVAYRKWVEEQRKKMGLMISFYMDKPECFEVKYGVDKRK